MKKPTKFTSYHPRLVLFITTLLLISSAIGYKMTAVNYDILIYLPRNLKSTEGQNILDKDFNNAATGMLILKGTDQDAGRLREEISKIGGVGNVVSKSSIVGNSASDEFSPDSIEDVFYAEDSTLMLVKLKNSASSLETTLAIDQIKNLESKERYSSGISSLVGDIKDVTSKETPIYVALAVVLGLIVLALTNGSAFVPFVFILIIEYAVTYNPGTNIFLEEIFYITRAIAAILQPTATMDYSTSLYHRYVEEKKYKENKNAAMGVALQETILPLFTLPLTTSTGFIVLALMELSLGKDIGLVMSKGVVIGLSTTVTVLPAMLLLVEKLVLKYNHGVLLPSLDRFLESNIRHKRVIFMVLLGLFILVLIGSSDTRVYHNLDRSPSQDLDPIVTLKKMKKDYNMAITHSIVVEDNLSNTALDSLIDKLEEVNGVNFVLGINTMTGVALPEEILFQKATDNFVKDGYKMIMVGPEYQAASEKVKAQVQEIRKIISKYDPEGYSTRKAVLTGDLAVTSDKGFRRINIVPIAVVFLIIAPVFRSFGAPITLVVVIELVIQISMGPPFYMGRTISFITSIIIGVIQSGSAIDYPILITNRFPAEYQTLGDVDKALKLATKETPKSIVTSELSFMTVTIGVGFYSKVEIVPTICTSLTRGVTISMIVIVLSLPAVISVSFPLTKETTEGLN